MKLVTITVIPYKTFKEKVKLTAEHLTSQTRITDLEGMLMIEKWSADNGGLAEWRM